MAVKLKRLNQQVMVITGASSGIGLVTARAAAERGTRLVLASRSQGELQQLKEEITRMAVKRLPSARMSARKRTCGG
jgi:short-subunit dehydrogenase